MAITIYAYLLGIISPAYSGHCLTLYCRQILHVVKVSIKSGIQIIQALPLSVLPVNV